MDAYTRAFLSRLEQAFDQKPPYHGLDEWITTYTFLRGAPFSFKHHEYQQQIAADVRPELRAKKCSQVGFTELIARITLAYCATAQGMRAMYFLPTGKFAQKFSKDRIDTVIEESPALSAAIVKAANGSEFKRIGSSSLYLLGTKGEGATISVPASLVVIDELDFCDPKPIGQISSRLRHHKTDNLAFRRMFSTPTVPGIGISAEFEASTQAFYEVKCLRCGHWQTPDFYETAVVPGFDRPMQEFDEQDLQNPTYRFDLAHFACAHCQKELTPSINIPAQRRWVERYPSREIAGYQISPWDVPHYNPLPSVFQQRAEYQSKADWKNFVLGQEHADETNSIINDRVQPTIDPIAPPFGERPHRAFLGVDIGKTSWALVGVPSPAQSGLDIVYAAQLRFEKSLSLQIVELLEFFNVEVAVVDAAPDFSTVQTLLNKAFPGQVWGCYYTRNEPRNLDSFKSDEQAFVIQASRTRTLDKVAERVNSGFFRFPKCMEFEQIKRQLQSMRRAELFDEEGGKTANWVRVRTEPTHYFHALNYLSIAYSMQDEKEISSLILPPPRISGVRMK